MKRALLIVCVALLAACVKVPVERQHALAPTLYKLGNIASVWEFHLQDGTRCVYVSSAAVTCEWRGLQ